MRTYQKQINKKKTPNKLLNKTARAKSPALKHKSKVINACFVFRMEYPRLCVLLILVHQSGLKRKKGGGGTLRRAS